MNDTEGDPLYFVAFLHRNRKRNQMKQRTKQTTILYLALMVLGIVALAGTYTMRTTIAAALPQTPAQTLQQIWKAAGTAGRYTYKSNIAQTINPVARLDTVGRAPRTQQMAVSGQLDTRQETMHLQLQLPNQAPMEIRIADGVAEGRLMPDAEWQTVDEVTDLFAPSGDPLGYLSAIENVRVIAPDAGTGSEETLFPSALLPDQLSAAMIRYAFQIDGPRYAEFMRRNLEEELRRKGDLPTGITLGLAQQFVEMTGEGELWVNSDGFPVRQIVHLRFPPRSYAKEWVETAITTDFSGWATQPGISVATIWQQPTQAFTALTQSLGLSRAALQQLGYTLGLLFLLLAFVLLTITHRRAQFVRVPLVVAVILAMVVAPLLQTQQASAFYDRHADQASVTPANETNELADLSAQEFNPHESQLERTTDNVALTNHPTNATLSTVTTSAAASQQSAQTTTDCPTPTESTDCDNDGLLDSVELYELGTWIDDADSDDDGISDRTEVLPFTVNGQIWYLDPRNPDSNGDGMIDLLECPERHDMQTDGVIDPAVTPGNCRDTDGDGAPDVYDFDNDGDGVPDSADLSPQNVETVADGQFGLTLDNVVAGQDTVVDLQIRPTDARNLWYVNNVLNWPGTDDAGQIKRMTNDTFDKGNGDMLLSPMLEINIPFDAANPARSLPVATGVDVQSIAATTPLEEWLDTATLDEYGITASLDKHDSSIWLYVPVTQVEDPIGYAPVALSARIPYQQNAATWGAAHTIKLLWAVTMQTDELVDDVWTSNTIVVESYYDDFMLTGLSVDEAHGASSVVIGQAHNVTGGNANYDNYLLHLADVLNNVFMEGERKADGNRFTVADIKNSLTDWGIPAGALVVDERAVNLANEVDVVATLNGEQMDQILTDVYGASPADSTVGNLLVVSESSQRSASFSDATMTNNQLQITFADPAAGVALDTVGSMVLKPYLYSQSEGWVDIDSTSYVQAVAPNWEAFYTEARLQSLNTDPLIDVETARAGALLLLTGYYQALLSGTAAQLVIDGEALGVTDLDNTRYQLTTEPALTIVSTLLAETQTFYTRSSLDNVTITTVSNETDAVANAIWALLGASSSATLDAIGSVATGSTDSATGQALLELTQYSLPIATADINYNVAMVYVSQSMSKSLTGFLRPQLQEVGVAGYTVALAGTSTLLAVSSALQYKYIFNYREFLKVSEKLAASPGKTLPKATKGVQKIKRSWKGAAVFGLVTSTAMAGVTISVALGTGSFTAGSPAFESLLADQVAGLIVSGIVAGITLVPGGQVLMGALGIIDGLIGLGCSIARASGEEINPEVDTWVCGGLTQAFTVALTYVIHDFTPLVDLENKDRLDISLATPLFTPTSGKAGIVTGNELLLSGVITSALYANTPNWMGYIYNWQLDDSYLDNTTFDYRFQPEPKDVSLDRGGTTWNATPGRKSSYGLDGVPDGERFYQTFNPSTSITLKGPGINQSQQAYLSESFAMEAQSCWLLPNPALTPPLIPVCWLQEYEDSFHNDLGNSLVFDVFPATLNAVGAKSGFHTLAESSDNSYRLAWDQRFPVIADADNDGLLSKAVGGIDPNDSQPDSDGDGLSDYFEKSIGFDAEAADGDCDGLTDYWELLYNTNPYSADSDNDGLFDSAERLHPNRKSPYENGDSSNAVAPACVPANVESIPVVNGSYVGGWEVVYDYDANDKPLHFWVNADPTDPDSDDDGISDRKEFVYGYNPQVPSSLQVLALDTSIAPSSAAAPYVKPGDTIDYSATIQNDLRNRYARGLLQSEFPVDVVQETRVFADGGVLGPQESVEMNGSLVVDVNSSLVTSMTLRAGAVIVPESDALVHLSMSEAAGATSFRDITIPHNDDFVCVNNGCPTANGRSLTFNDTYIQGTDAALNTLGSLTIAALVDPSTYPDPDLLVFELGDFKIVADGPIIRILEGAQIVMYAVDPIYPGNIASGVYSWWDSSWTHVAFTYNAVDKTAQLYISGLLLASGTLNTAPTGSTLTMGGYGGIDDLKIYAETLDAATIRDLANAARVNVALTDDPNASNTDNVACVGSRCPTVDPNTGATFDQKTNVQVSDSALALTGDAFSFSILMAPHTRTYEFDTRPVVDNFTQTTDQYTLATHDTEQDWQGLFGQASGDKIYPSMFVSDAGRLRMVWGSSAAPCIFTSTPNLINYDGAPQFVTVTYARDTATSGTLVLYINGIEVDRGSVNSCSDVNPATNFSTWDTIQIGRPNTYGYFYFNDADFTDLRDPGDKAELCLNFDEDGDGTGRIWHDFNVQISDSNTAHIYPFTLKRIADDTEGDDLKRHWFRLHEDDGNKDDCDYGNDNENEYLYRTSLGNRNPLGIFETGFSSGVVVPDKGTLYWSLSNDFFDGDLKDFNMHAYALSPESALAFYQDRAVTLKMTMDEAPGQTRFIDSAGNYLEATCAGTSCPDSGIPGRANQALRFDGGVADDDGNDGVADYLSLSASEADLGLSERNFTIMAWVKPDVVNGVRRILAAGRTNSANGVGFGVRDGNLLFTTFGVKDYRSTASNIPAGQWSHVAVSFDANNDAHFYVNGQFIQTVAGTAPAQPNPDDAYLIGATTVAGSQARSEVFDGLIDDLRVVRSAMDKAGIQAMMDEAPLLNLHLDEDLGTTTYVNDSPNAAAGTCSGDSCPGAGDKGQMREAAVFDGDDLIDVADSDDLDLDEFTIALWVKPTQVRKGGQVLLDKSSTTINRNYAILLQSNSLKVTYSIVSGCTALKYVDSEGALLQNQWNHVVMTYDGTQARLYINGALDNSVLNVTAPCHNTAPVQIGKVFSGNLDEITIQKGALRQSEVAALYDYQSSWFDVKEQHQILVDAVAPTVALDYSLDYVAPGQVIAFAIDDPTVNGVASGIAKVQVLFNDAGSSVVYNPEFDGCWCITLPATLSGGTLNLAVGATDRVGNVANSQIFTLKIDGTAPLVTVNSTLTSGITQASEQLVIRGTVSDSQSGIVANSVSMQLSDALQQPVSAVITATVGGTKWLATQPFDSAPYGAYTVRVWGRDAAGNETDELFPGVQLDGIAPYADLPTTSQLITQTGTVLSGIVSDVPYPVNSSRLVHLHFEEAAGANAFVNGSIYAGNSSTSAERLTATCNPSTSSEQDSCPVAGVGGPFGSALQFDGTNDYLTMPYVLDPANGPFTAMAWFNVTSHPTQRNILQQMDGSGPGRSWLYVLPNGQLGTFLGGTGMQNAYVTDNTWQHAAVTYDGTTVKLYLNGKLSISRDKVMESSLGAVLIGRAKSAANFFHGAIDEVALYGRALSDSEIYNIANPLAVGIAQTQIRFSHLDGEVTPWVDATVADTSSNFTTWSYTLDDELEGPYKVDLQVTDGLGNSRIVQEAWAGVIDTVAPRVTFAYVPNADYRNAQVRCTADDEHLVETGWACPVDNSYRTVSYQDAAWYTERITDSQMIVQLTTSQEMVVVEPSPSMSACDLYGHCTTVVSEISVLETGASGAQAATVQVAAMQIDTASDEVVAAAVEANGTSVSVYSALQLVNTSIELSTVYPAYDAAIHMASWLWGDGTTSLATVDAASGAISGSHVYSAAGIYAATLNVTENGSSLVAFTVPFDVVVYDPDAGKMAGGGKIDSPASAYKLDESISGLADFNLPVDYQKNATQPKGNFRFGLPAAGMDFIATDYEWLIVYPVDTAMAKGIGTINGQMDANGNPYHFWLWATDGDTDTLRVRIWTEDESQYIWWQDAGGTVIYDNGSEMPINNGNVQVIVSKGNGRGQAAQVESVATEASVVDALSLGHQLYLPLIAGDTVVAAQAAETDHSDDDSSASELVDSEPEQVEANVAETPTVLSNQIFLPLVQGSE